ncbi:MAG: HAD-IIA family hydrolase [Acidimicrobiia bacterium]
MAPVVLCDLDGVVWLAGVGLPGAAEAVVRLRDAGLAVGFLTNNSSLTVDEYLGALERIGIPAGPEDLLSSAMAAAAVLAGDLPAGAKVLACAGPGVVEALEAHGFEVVSEGPCEAVVVGWHRDFDFPRLARAAAALRAGARFVATNLDPTYPGPDGLLPGNGSLVAAVATASGRTPEVAGKPEPPTVALVRHRYGNHGVMVGDRPSTDGALATALGWPFALVISDATVSSDEPADPGAQWVADSLADLVDPLAAALAPGGPPQR